MSPHRPMKRHLDILALKGLAPQPEQTLLMAEEALELVYGGRAGDGIDLLRALVKADPGSATAAHALGTALSTTGDYASALPHHRRAVELAPEDPRCRHNLAFTLESLGEVEEAEAAYRTAWELDPAYARAAMGYSRMRAARLHFGDAVGVLRQALRYSPEDMTLLAALANALIFAGEPERALLYYRVLFDAVPDDRKTVGNFLYALLMVRRISPEIIAEELESCAGLPLLRQLAMGANRLARLEGDDLLAYHRTAGARIESRNNPGRPCRRRSPHEAKRLRVGYISSDLYNHPMGYLMQGVLPNHDRRRFEIFVFSPFESRDELTTALQQAAEHWVVLDSRDRDRAAEAVLAAEPDILVELAGHTGDNWLDLCARRLAPVQITWGGYPSTTGLSTMDHILADTISLPERDTPYYTERPLRLPGGYACFIPPADAPPPAPPPSLARGVVTFGSFLTLHKLNSTTVALWASVLRAVPDAGLYLKARALGDPDVAGRVLEKFAKERIDPARITLAGGSPRLEMLDEYRQIDICLDPVPYQGGVTILEAAWMGVPTLLLKGDRPPFIRHGENYLAQMGLGEWIARTETDYLEKAAAWACDRRKLLELRLSLRNRMASSPICDTVGFTRSLEAALESAWQGDTTPRG